MNLGLILLAVVVLATAFVLARRTLGRRRQRAARRQQLRVELANIRRALEEFERTTDFDEQIRLLADITRYCSKGFRLFPDQPDLMNIARYCEDERRKLAQHWAVAESQRLMKLVEDSATLRVKAGRADQVAESLKVASRLLFPHEKITNAMRSVTQCQEALEGILELPEAERDAAATGALTLLDSYFAIMEELRRESEELARVPWAGEPIRQILARLERL
ncbi:MAG: hypothetical protein HYY26_02950 [Acidobacteria bacterium]|nr:hypothetical protein [Acidobacteriota bacterium]